MNVKMAKRKLEEINGANPINHAASTKQTRLQQRQLEGLLEQGKKSLLRSLKIVRGFERQKLGRRQKTAKAEGDGAASARLDTEVSALKVSLSSLDIPILAYTNHRN